jgi:hypothetical protein
MVCPKVAPTFNLFTRFPSSLTSMPWVAVRNATPPRMSVLTVACSGFSQRVLCRTRVDSADISYGCDTQTNSSCCPLLHRVDQNRTVVIKSLHQTGHSSPHRLQPNRRAYTPSPWHFHPPIFDLHIFREPQHCRRPRSPPSRTPASGCGTLRRRLNLCERTEVESRALVA